MDNFFAYFGAANGYTDARVAIASCRSTSTSFTYTRYASLTSNTATLQSAVDAIVVNNNEQNIPVWGPNCMAKGMNDANVGWRSNSFRVVAFLSGNTMFTTYDLTPDIYATNVVPLFYLPTASASTIASTKAYAATLPVAFINYGSTNDNSKKYQGWSLDVYKAVNGTTNTIYFGRTSDLAVYDTFIRTVPGNVTLPFGQIVNTSVTIGYPTGHNVSSYPSFTAEVTAYGFGTQQYLITVVQPPTAYGGAYSGLQGADISFTVSGIAPSGQSLGLVVVSSPNGEVYNSAGTVGPYALNTVYTGLTHTFRPTASFYGLTYITVRVNDGCQSSSSVNVTFNITRSNTAPRATAFTVTIPYNSRVLSEQRVNFTDYISDATDAISTLIINVTSASTTSLGQLVVDSTSAAVTAPYLLGTGRTLRFVPTMYRSGTYSFQFTVADPAGLVSTTTTVTIVVTFNNTLPTLTATTTTFYSPRGSVTNIPLTAYDPDFGTSLTLIASTNTNINMSSVQITSPTAGTVMNSASALPFTLAAAASTDANGNIAYTLRWVVSASAVNYDAPFTLTLYVTDSNSGSSANLVFNLWILAPPVSPNCAVGYIANVGSLVCYACNCGTSSLGDAASSCFNCNAGQYSNSSSAFVCSTCPAGTVSSSGACQCTVCTGGYTSNAGTSTCNVLCPNNTYSSAATGGVCTACPAGSVAIAPAGSCTQCTAGTYQSGTSCLTCSAGTTSTAGSTSCTQCAYNQYSNSSTSGICTTCPTGFITNAAQSGCIQCAAGYYPFNNTCVLCPDGSSSTAGATSISSCVSCNASQVSSSATGGLCTNCPSGSVPNAGRTACVTCVAGTYSNGTACVTCASGTTTTASGATSCTACTTGTYSNSSTSGICQTCPAGQIPNAQQSGCVSCPAGYYQSGSVCLICPDGSTSTISSTSCTACPAEQYSNTTTAGICTYCPAGQIVNTGRSGCTACAAGTYQTSNTTCTACPNGSSSSAGATSCTACTTGFFSSSSTGNLCADCPPGTVTNADKSACLQCAAGTYDNGANVCVVCTAGTTSIAGSTSCSACPAGLYSNATTNGICTACPAGQITPTQTGCQACSAGYYQSGNLCLMCAAGTTSTAGSTSCTACSSSTYSNSSTNGICQPCQAGYVPNAQSTSCVACTAGTYQSGASCVNCAAGTSSGFAATTCTACNNGYYSSALTNFICQPCAAGLYSVANKSVCDVCPAGYTSLAGTAGSAAACTACNSSTYSNPTLTVGICSSCSAGYIPLGASGGSGPTNCTICPANTYQNGITCTNCPVVGETQTTSAAGSFSSTQCSSCQSGYYINATVNNVCTPCPAGTYSLGNRCEYCPAGTSSPAQSVYSQCTPCSADFYSSSATYGICQQCPAGQVPNAAKDGCTACPIGYYESPDGTCTPCPAGQSTASTGSISSANCTVCPPGQTSTAASSYVCTNCPAGTYSDVNGICQACPAYQISSAGSSSCTNCTAGYYASANTCLMCPAGQTSVSGSTSCVACNSTTYSNATTNGICLYCPAGLVPTADRTGCVFCPAGYYESGGVCLVCIIGTQTLTTGRTSCDPCGPRQYQEPTTTFGICQTCPSGQVADAAASGCTTCVAGTYQLNNTCVNCNPGQTSSAGSTSCSQCSSSQYSNATTAFICTSCPAGSIVNGSQSGCQLCSAGFYQSGQTCVRCADGQTSNAGATSCFNCPSTQYSNATTAGTCTTCPAFYIVNPLQSGCVACPAGQVKLNETACQACANGTSSTGSGSCTACPNGQYSNVLTGFICTACPAGTYSIDSECVRCPNGTTSTLGSADNAGSCTACPAGAISNVLTGGLCQQCGSGSIPDATSSSCTSCPAGTYKFNSTYCALCGDGLTSSAGTGSTAGCTSCGIGQYSNTTTNGICQSCPAGTYSTGGQCVRCPDGTSSTTGGATGASMCGTCATDQYSNSSTNGICQTCPGGFVSNPTKSGCVACQAGFYELNGVCVRCPNGYTSVVGANGVGQCTLCAPGEYSNDITGGICQACPAGTKSVNGVCVACADGTISATNSSVCNNCPAGYYSNPDKTACLPCAPGTSTSAGTTGSSAGCTACSFDTYSNASTNYVCVSCPDGYTPNGFQDGCVRAPRPPTIALAPTANSSVPLKVYQGDVLPFTISAADRDFQQYLTLRMFLPVADKIYFNNALTTTAPLSPASSFIAAQNISRFNIEYRPDPSYFGLAGVSYFANDADNLNSTLDTVFLEVVHVNHQPVAYGFDVYTLENNIDQANVVTRISNQFVFSDFDGSYDQYSLVILSLPSRGTLSKQDLSAVVAGEPIPQVLSAFTVLFTPVVNTFDTTGVYTSFTFQICDNSMNATTNCSLVQTANIYVGPVNHPPSSASVNVTLLQNGNTSFAIRGDDSDSWDSNDADVKLIVISRTGLGEFYTDAAFSAPLQLSVAVYPRTLYYKPPRNIASPAPDVPLATLRFRVVDDNTTFSGIYDVNVYVTPILQPPEYKGDLRFAVPQNTPTTFLLAATAFFDNWNQGFDFRYNAAVVKLPARGSFATCDADDICTDVSINGVPVNAGQSVYPISHPDGKIVFTGDKDTFGDNYAYLVYTVTDNLGQTATVNVSIDVTHVNQKPKIVDFTWADSSIILNENETAIIKFKVVDVDSPPQNLRLRFSSRSVARYGWTLNSCSDNATAAPCSISSEVATRDSPARNVNPNVTAVLTSSCDVPYGYPVTDFSGCSRFYVMQFTPAMRTYSYQYAQFTFTVSDDEDLESEPQLIYVVVLPINDAPTIQAPSRITGANGATLVRLVDTQTNQRIVVDDFDSTRGSELLLDVEYVSGLDGDLVTSANATGNCRINQTAADMGKPSWRCTGTLNSLNVMLAGASWEFVPTGTAESADEITTLKFTINDQGSTSVDNNDPKFATATVAVAYTRPASVITVPPANNWATIVAIIVALLLLAIIAGVLYRLRKNLKTPNDDYFSLGTSAIATAPENPLFKAATKEGFNKLFKAKGADEVDISEDASYSDS
eukprot:TRINITY_DN638_c0_g3_i1.p1 TRINITY_DN638_c0_g3~~TRINITY_DN638_c0_g3_i1.p1  ORF type:complete len:3128 (-),score=621.80 TRINITY_DN638_c0_g3_i1:85-9090(-)